MNKLYEKNELINIGENKIWKGNEKGIARVEQLESINNRIVRQRDSIRHMYNYEIPESFDTIHKLSGAIRELNFVIEELTEAEVELECAYCTDD